MDAPNSTVSHVRKFITRPPNGAVRLTVFASAGGAAPQKLNTWTKDEAADPNVAVDLVAQVDELVVTMEAQVTAVLTWLDEQGGEIGSKTIKRRPAQAQSVNADDVMVEPGAEALAKLDGSVGSLVMQAQKHTEVMTRLYVAAMGGQMHTMQKTNEHILELMERMGAQLADQDHRLRKANAERDAAVSAYAEAMEGAGGDAGGGESDGTNAAQSQAMKFLEPIVQNLLMKMLQAQNPTSPGGAGSGG